VLVSIVNIREHGEVVGKIDTDTGMIVEITSHTLAAEWEHIQKEGFRVTRPTRSDGTVLGHTEDLEFPGPSKGWLLAVELGRRGFRWDRPD